MSSLAWSGKAHPWLKTRQPPLLIQLGVLCGMYSGTPGSGLFSLGFFCSVFHINLHDPVHVELVYLEGATPGESGILPRG